MEIKFRAELINKFNTDIYKLLELFKTGEGESILKQLGEEFAVQRVKCHNWGNKKRDDEFIYNLMRDLNIYGEPEIHLQDTSADRENDIVLKRNINYSSQSNEFSIKGVIKLVNTTFKKFMLNIHHVEITNTKIITTVEPQYKDGGSLAEINYNISIPPYHNENYNESIIIHTNYKTYTLNINLHCKNKEKSDVRYEKVETLQEIVSLYLESPQEALDIFKDKHFRQWLRDNKYYAECEVYENVMKLNKKYEKEDMYKIQSFLEILSYDVTPKLKVDTLDDGVIILKNEGKGYLYGNIECKDNIKLSSKAWNQNNNKILIENENIDNVKYEKIKFVSNGGVTYKILIGFYNIVKKESEIITNVNEIEPKQSEETNYTKNIKDKGSKIEETNVAIIKNENNTVIDIETSDRSKENNEKLVHHIKRIVVSVFEQHIKKFIVPIIYKLRNILRRNK